jgi:hypothetical protein
VARYVAAGLSYRRLQLRSHQPTGVRGACANISRHLDYCDMFAGELRRKETRVRFQPLAYRRRAAAVFANGEGGSRV